MPPTEASSSGGVVDLEQLRDQLKNDPENPGYRAKLFWSLHQEMKTEFEGGKLEKAAFCLLEMANYQPGTEKSANATGWAVHKILKSLRDGRSDR